MIYLITHFTEATDEEKKKINHYFKDNFYLCMAIYKLQKGMNYGVNVSEIINRPYAVDVEVIEENA